MSESYANPGPSREDVDVLQGPALLEFGTAWCGHCQAAAPAASEALAEFSGTQHVKVEDGPGRPLGRSFRVKLWPTFIGLKDGVEITRTVRPTTADEIRQVLTKLQ
jgi:thioredoxin 1